MRKCGFNRVHKKLLKLKQNFNKAKTWAERINDKINYYKFNRDVDNVHNSSQRY